MKRQIMPHSSSANDDAIVMQGVTKRFGHVTALDKMDLRVGRGEVHGLLGPNGAGKSTAIRVLLGLLRKDGGEATIFGHDCWKDAVKLHRRLAYVPGDVTLWDNLSGGEIIDLLTHLRGQQDKQLRKRLIERFQLDPTKKFRTYSKGNRQKVALVAALASDVELYLLDEPTSGLDPLLELVFQEEVQRLKNDNKTILLSSHILAEVEALCDRVTIIREGRVVESGSLDDLRHLADTTFKVSTKKDASAIAQHAGVHDVKTEGNYLTFQVKHAHLDEVLAALATYKVEAIVSHPPTLEELFMGHYKHEVAATE